MVAWKSGLMVAALLLGVAAGRALAVPLAQTQTQQQQQQVVFGGSAYAYDDEPLIVPPQRERDPDDPDEDDDGSDDPDSVDTFPEDPEQPGKLRYSAFSFSDALIDHAETARVAAQLHAAFGTTPSRKVPIVLVHGFLGFDNLLGVLKYFGGFTGDVARHLRKLGYRVLVPSVGPISSNWERACELYAQLRGTVVDYGLARSRKYGHQRYGRSYVGKALYPEWGSTADAQINIIAHSQGGPTARMLVHLLRHGFDDEELAIEAAVKADPANPNHGPISPLLSTRTTAQLVRSVVTISSPLQGTTIIEVIDDWLSFLYKIVKGVYGLTGAVGPDGAFPYDFMLDHWGLTRQKGERLEAFVERLRKSTYLKLDSNGFYDNAVYGTKAAVNSFVRNDPNVFYFSVSNADTTSVLLSNRQVPKKNMNPIIMGFSTLMGQYTNKKAGIDSTWHENDGIVTRRGMDFSLNEKKVEYPFADLAAQPTRPKLCPICAKVPPQQVAAPKPGVWNHLTFIEDWDHVDVIGVTSLKSKKRLYNIYENLAAIVSAVPHIKA